MEVAYADIFQRYEEHIKANWQELVAKIESELKIYKTFLQIC